MSNLHNYLILDERQDWNSTYENQIAALKRQQQRAGGQNRKSGFLAFLQAPLQKLAALLG